MRSISARTPRTMSSVFAFDCASTGERRRRCGRRSGCSVRSFSAASCTFATSPRRTRCPSSPRAITRLRKSSSVSRPTSVRSENSRVRDSRRPAGSSTFSRRSASSMSVDRELTRGERLAIDPDAHRVAATAADGHARHARHGREPIDQVALGVVGDFEHRHRVGAEAARTSPDRRSRRP